MRPCYAFRTLCQRALDPFANDWPVTCKKWVAQLSEIRRDTRSSWGKVSITVERPLNAPEPNGPLCVPRSLPSLSAEIKHQRTQRVKENLGRGPVVPRTANDDLRRSGFESPAQRVFLQRWLELLHYQTIDTYAVKLLNAHSALLELQEVLHDVLRESIHGQHVGDVWEEARVKVQQDIVLLQQQPNLHSAILRALTSCPKATKREHLRRSLEEIQPLAEQLGNVYLNSALHLAEAALQGNNPEMAEATANLLASESAISWHLDSLYKLGERLLRGSGTAERRYDDFLRSLKQEPVTMYVFIPAQGDWHSHQAHLSQAGFALVSLDEIRNRGVHGSLDWTGLPQRYVVHHVRARDIRMAAMEARDKLSQAIDAISLFLQDPLSLPPQIALVEYPAPGGRRLDRVSLNRSEPRFSRQQQIEPTLNLLYSTDLDTSDHNRIRAMIEYTRLSAIAHSPASRFIHLWVALESLVGQTSAQIVDIRRYVPPLLAQGYAYRLVRNFIEDCLRCGVDIESFVGVPRTNRRQAVKSLIEVLQDPVRLQALSAMCGQQHDLLALRAKDLHRHFKNGKALANLLLRHQRNISWHLQRMYRLRNAAVHAGETHPFVTACTRHLHDYVGIVLNVVRYSLSSGKQKSIWGVLAMCHHTFFSTVEVLQAKQGYDPELVIQGVL